MKPIDFFLKPSIPAQKQFEALRRFYVDKRTADEVARHFSFSPAYFKKLRYSFNQQLKNGQNPFFEVKKRGPKKYFTKMNIVEEIITLRKQNYSILDIKAALDAKERFVSPDTIDKILKKEGFERLPRRTRFERISTILPEKIKAPATQTITLEDQSFLTEKGAGPLIFLPLIEKLKIIDAIKKCDFPGTSIISNISYIMSFIALKILGTERLSFDETWNLDRAIGLFAKLNVLPKNASLSSYSYQITREENKKLLLELSQIFKDDPTSEDEFNLDFKSIPHWGDASVLEKNWSGSRSKRIKSILALIVEDPATGYLDYTHAGLLHSEQNDAVLDFVDFWTDGQGKPPKMLIFDSKFTTYRHLDQLNQSQEKIKFLTLRRRGKKLLERIDKISPEKWQIIHLENRKHEYLKVYEEYRPLRNYSGKVRQIIITDNGRPKPSILITNDFELSLKVLIQKYARRWLVEKEIAEQIKFFHLNNPSSSIVVKVDFDVTLSLLTHNLYRYLTSKLHGFEKCTVPTIYRSFLENGAEIKIKDRHITVALKKKTHLPLLFQLPWLNEKTTLSWMDATIEFIPANVS